MWQISMAMALLVASGCASASPKPGKHYSFLVPFAGRGGLIVVEGETR